MGFSRVGLALFFEGVLRRLRGCVGGSVGAGVSVVVAIISVMFDDF